MGLRRKLRRHDPEPGEWIYPNPRHYKLVCCDCGLSHRMQFRIWIRPNGTKSIQYRAWRDERSTAAFRREAKKRGE